MENNICHFFVAGHCRNGKTCRFEHPDTVPTLLSLGRKAKSISRSQSGDFIPKTKIPCKFYLEGTCTRGDFCNFEHSNPTTATATIVRPISKDSRSRIPCRYFQRDVCNVGELCPFSHEIQGDLFNPKTPLDHRPIPETGLAASTWARSNLSFRKHDEFELPSHIGGATVLFADGASVSTVSLILDFSAVSTSELPQHTSVQDVMNLMSSRGFTHVTPDCVRFKIIPEKLLKTAMIKVRDPDFASRLLQCLGNAPNSWRQLESVQGPFFGPY